jgi:glutaredoxin
MPTQPTFIMYTKNNCSQCVSSKAAIDAQDLTKYVTVINVDEDSEALNKLRSIGVRTMPAFSSNDGSGERFSDLFTFMKQIKTSLYYT